MKKIIILMFLIFSTFYGETTQNENSVSLKNGVEKIYLKNGEYDYSVEYVNGNVEKIYYKEKELITKGKYVIKNSLNEKYLKFEIKNSKINGKLIEYKDNKKYKVSSYLNGKKNGEEITYLGKIKWMKTPYKNGLINGVKIINFSNMEKPYMTFEFVNGVQTGKQTVNYTTVYDGKTYLNEEFYNVDGQHNGAYKKYYTEHKGFWMFSKPILEETGNYVEGKREGLFVGYDIKGRKEYEVIYKNGQKDGVEKNYKKNILVKETTYIKGLKNGIEKNYDKKGKLVNQIDYKDNKIVKVTTYKNGEIIKVSDKEEME